MDDNLVLHKWSQDFADRLRGISVEAIDDIRDYFPRLEVLQDTFNGFVLSDLAGDFSDETIFAGAGAHLTISPAKLSVPDLTEAMKLHHEMDHLAAKIGKPLNHRLLINELPNVRAAYHDALLESLTTAALKPLETRVHQRAAYTELFLTGEPPHFADATRYSIAKAREEIDSLTDEVLAALKPQELAEAA